MKVYSGSSGPPPSLWVVRDLQVLHKAWRGQGAARPLQSQNSSPPRPSPFSSRGKKKKKKTTYSPDRTGWSCQNDGYHSIWGPAPPETGWFPTSSLPWTLFSAPKSGERCLGKNGGEHRGSPFKRGPPCSQTADQPFPAHVYQAVMVLSSTCPVCV